MATRKAKGNELTVQQLKHQLTTHKDAIREMIGRQSDVDHYIAGIIEECDRNPAIRTCDPNSILQCVRKAALLRLPLGQSLCYFIPYGGVCTFQMGYRGLLRLARDEKAILRHVVDSAHEGDHLHDGSGHPPDCGLFPKIKLEKYATDRTWENCTHVYAHFALPNNQEHLELMTKDQVLAHRSRYVKAIGKDSPWQTNPLAMALKTVVKRAFAADQIPVSGHLRQVIQADDNPTTVDGEVIQPQDALESLSGDPDEAVKEEIRRKESGIEAGLFDTHEQSS